MIDLGLLQAESKSLDSVLEDIVNTWTRLVKSWINKFELRFREEMVKYMNTFCYKLNQQVWIQV